jgi:hypothetical protein
LITLAASACGRAIDAIHVGVVANNCVIESGITISNCGLFHCVAKQHPLWADKGDRHVGLAGQRILAGIHERRAIATTGAGGLSCLASL